MSHPNKLTFTGVLSFVDRPSDKSPHNARGHRIRMTRKTAELALPSLIGMGVNCKEGFDGHDVQRKIGVIEEAVLCDDAIMVAGYLFVHDFESHIASIKACAETGDMGMSYELADAHVHDMNADIWELDRVTFTGAAILYAHKAAYKGTSIQIAK